MSRVTFESPLSLYSIPVVWFTVFYPMKLKANLEKPLGYSRIQPRSNAQKISNDTGVTAETANRMARMEGAHMNGNEILPLWIAAVIVSNQARIAHKTVNTVSVAFIAMRVLYNYVYINNKTLSQTRMRTAVWLASLAMPMTLIVTAANKVRKLGGLTVL